MAYFVFDLDLTLADLTGLYRSIETKTENTPEYTTFIQSLANNELDIFSTSSSVQKGLLRPNILTYMIQILELKLTGQCKGVIIYSNNLFLKSLHVVRDVLINCMDQLLESSIPIDQLQSLFCLCIHRRYQGRPTNTDDPPKTWDELSRIMLSNKDVCGIDRNTVEINKEHIYFFDDRVPAHAIKNELPPGHYVQVEPYIRSKSSYSKILELNAETITPVINSMLKNTNRSNTIIPLSPVTGGRHTQYTVRNRIKQKKQQRKHKYSKKQRQKRGKKSSS